MNVARSMFTGHSRRSRRVARRLIVPMLCVSILLSTGCRRDPGDDPAENRTTSESHGSSETTGSPALPQVFELEPERLLAQRLPTEMANKGWVKLFDGQSLFGWDMAGLANWSIEDETLVVSGGNKSLLCTSLPWENFQFRVEFQADPQTNSGIFLRTPLVPMDPATDCYELNIAPADNPFPTGSLVGRRRLEPEQLGQMEPNAWHTYDVRCQDDTITITLDDRELYSYQDPDPIRSGRIALQHNTGRVAFRNVMARPLGLKPLLPESRADSAELTDWKRYPDMAGSFTFDEEGNLHVQGGKGQLETDSQYDNFVLHATAKTAGPNQNSGIFFRCIPGQEMNGYECQINNDTVDGNVALPADCGTGGFFRRQDARIVAAENAKWFDLVLIVNGPQMAAWVNGIQVSQWQDTRDPDPNPRRGLRTDAGTIILQAHDETTDVSFATIEIVPLAGGDISLQTPSVSEEPAPE
jgi:hypothetical protein